MMEPSLATGSGACGLLQLRTLAAGVKYCEPSWREKVAARGVRLDVDSERERAESGTSRSSG